MILSRILPDNAIRFKKEMKENNVGVDIGVRIYGNGDNIKDRNVAKGPILSNGH